MSAERPIPSGNGAASPQCLVMDDPCDGTAHWTGWRPRPCKTAVRVRSRAPLRLGFGGGGTDVSPYCDNYGGAILNATIDLYATTLLRTLDSPMVRFVAADRDEVFEAPAAPQFDLSGELLLHKAVYNYIVAHYNHS